MLHTHTQKTLCHLECGRQGPLRGRRNPDFVVIRYPRPVLSILRCQTSAILTTDFWYLISAAAFAWVYFDRIAQHDSALVSISDSLEIIGRFDNWLQLDLSALAACDNFSWKQCDISGVGSLQNLTGPHFSTLAGRSTRLFAYNFSFSPAYCGVGPRQTVPGPWWKQQNILLHLPLRFNFGVTEQTDWVHSERCHQSVHHKSAGLAPVQISLAKWWTFCGSTWSLQSRDIGLVHCFSLGYTLSLRN